MMKIVYKNGQFGYHQVRTAQECIKELAMSKSFGLEIHIASLFNPDTQELIFYYREDK